MLEYVTPMKISKWVEQTMEWKQKYPIKMKECKGMSPEAVIRYINENFDSPIVATDVGQNQLWTTQYFEPSGNGKLLTSGGLGTMGYGLPAALGAKLGNPGSTVIAISGDGGIQMNIQELATAMVYGLQVIIVILNNGYLGNVRQWQELFYGKRYSGTCLKYRKSCEKNCQKCAAGEEKCPKYIPDFIKLAESYEAHGIRIFKEEDIKKAFDYAMQFKDSPTIIECIIDGDANVFPMVPTGKGLSEIIMC